jgi:hypothetical protein
VSVAAAQAEASYREVIASGLVWSLGDAAGSPAPLTPDGHRAMPFWSKRSRADRIVSDVPAFEDFEVFQISLDEWRERWLPGLEGDGLRVGLNWSGKRATGFDLSVQDVIRNMAARETH